MDKVSQISMENTFKKKAVNSIMTKIALQMATKIRNILWKV
jgi:hypothetical protein